MRLHLEHHPVIPCGPFKVQSPWGWRAKTICRVTVA